MNKYLLTAAMAGVMAAGATSGAFAEAGAPKEKCYGIAKAGKNSCASSNGSHSCAGQAKEDNLATEWKFVGKGECVGLGGKLAEAKDPKNGCKH